jgi:hypothetical protein
LIRAWHQRYFIGSDGLSSCIEVTSDAVRNRCKDFSGDSPTLVMCLFISHASAQWVRTRIGKTCISQAFWGRWPGDNLQRKGYDMKRVVFLATILGMFLYAAVVPAQPRGSGGWGMGAPYGRMYDTKTVETISGVVEKVEKLTPMRGMSYGVHLLVKTEKETIDVHLGPDWYIDNQDVKIVPGDKVEVTGSRITFRSRPAIIAAEVKKGDEVLRLRDPNGVPVWAGWRRR